MNNMCSELNFFSFLVDIIIYYKYECEISHDDDRKLDRQRISVERSRQQFNPVVMNIECGFKNN